MNDIPINELLSAYLDGELTADQRTRVEQTLASDPSARSLLDELQALGATLKSLPPQDLDEDLSSRVLDVAARRMLADPARAAAEDQPTHELKPLWKELSWRGMISRRALAWSGIAVAVAVFLHFTDQGKQAGPQHVKVALHTADEAKDADRAAARPAAPKSAPLDSDVASDTGHMKAREPSMQAPGWQPPAVEKPRQDALAGKAMDQKPDDALTKSEGALTMPKGFFGGDGASPSHGGESHRSEADELAMADGKKAAKEPDNSPDLDASGVTQDDSKLKHQEEVTKRSDPVAKAAGSPLLEGAPAPAETGKTAVDSVRPESFAQTPARKSGSGLAPSVSKDADKSSQSAFADRPTSAKSNGDNFASRSKAGSPNRTPPVDAREQLALRDGRKEPKPNESVGQDYRESLKGATNSLDRKSSQPESPSAQQLNLSNGDQVGANASGGSAVANSLVIQLTVARQAANSNAFEHMLEQIGLRHTVEQRLLQARGRGNSASPRRGAQSAASSANMENAKLADSSSAQQQNAFLNNNLDSSTLNGNFNSSPTQAVQLPPLPGPAPAAGAVAGPPAQVLEVDATDEQVAKIQKAIAANPTAFPSVSYSRDEVRQRNNVQANHELAFNRQVMPLKPSNETPDNDSHSSALSTNATNRTSNRAQNYAPSATDGQIVPAVGGAAGAPSTARAVAGGQTHIIFELRIVDPATPVQLPAASTLASPSIPNGATAPAAAPAKAAQPFNEPAQPPSASQPAK